MGLRLRLRALLMALTTAWPVLLVLLGMIVAVAVGWTSVCVCSASPSAGIRYAGTALQICGLGVVARGLSKVRKSFGRPSLGEKVVAWFRQLGAAFFPPRLITAQGDMGGVARATGEMRGVVVAGPDASLDRRVTILEDNFHRLREELDAKETQVRTELRTLKAAVVQEQRAREAEARRISSHMEDFAVGGLHLEFVGLTWLFLGVLGTSLPDDLVTRLVRSLAPLMHASACSPV